MTPSTALRNLATSIVRKLNAGVADEEIVAFVKVEIERIDVVLRREIPERRET